MQIAYCCAIFASVKQPGMTYTHSSTTKAAISAVLLRAAASVALLAAPCFAADAQLRPHTEVASNSIAVPYDYTQIDPALYPDIYYGKSRLNAMTFKVNAMAAAALITNATFELEWKQWSVQLPMYYSNLDYFSHRVRFRVAAFQPGIRYWFDRDKVLGHTGFFVGAHVGLAWYNMSLGGSDASRTIRAVRRLSAEAWRVAGGALLVSRGAGNWNSHWASVYTAPITTTSTTAIRER